MRKWLWLTVIFVGVLLFGTAARWGCSGGSSTPLSIGRSTRRTQVRTLHTAIEPRTGGPKPDRGVFLSIPDKRDVQRGAQNHLECHREHAGAFGYIDESGNLVVPTMTRQVMGELSDPGEADRNSLATNGATAPGTGYSGERTIFSE